MMLGDGVVAVLMILYAFVGERMRCDDVVVAWNEMNGGRCENIVTSRRNLTMTDRRSGGFDASSGFDAPWSGGVGMMDYGDYRSCVRRIEVRLPVASRRCFREIRFRETYSDCRARGVGRLPPF